MLQEGLVARLQPKTSPQVHLALVVLMGCSCEANAGILEQLPGVKLSIGLLFVDDESSIRLTLPPILEEQGFQVQVADGVPSALQQISSQRFDVILTDLNITQSRDGFAVVKAARAANPSCVAIVLTGYPDFESAVEAINCGVDSYLVKPADIETLVATIRQRLAAKPLG